MDGYKLTKRKKILFHLESRATYGYARNVLRVIKNFHNLEYTTLVTGGHLDPSLVKALTLLRMTL